MKTKKYIYLIVSLALLGSCVLALPALADNNQQNINNQSDNQSNNQSDNQSEKPAVVGTVSSISGSTIMVAVKTKDALPAVTFTVNASNAQVFIGDKVAALSSIAVGDKVIVKGAVTGASVVATTIRAGKVGKESKDQNKMNPNMVGKVTIVNGNILTINVKQQREQNMAATATTFTVDATNAKILRGETIIKVSDIAVGDNLVVQGTVTGNNVVATMIRDGKIGNGSIGQEDNNQALSQIKNNGQPIISGKISAISAMSLTVTNSSNIIYTVDATNAKIVQGKNVITVSGVKIGDIVIVQGTVNGTNVIASTIIDGNNPVTAETIADNKPTPNKGFFGSIRDFFKSMFGF
jgi:hypothetical protein